MKSIGRDRPIVGLGCNSLGHIEPREAEALIGTAIDGGVRLFDTANCYAAGRSEEELGRLLPRDRDDLVLISKFGHPASAAPGEAPCSAQSVRRAVEGSLTRLRCERLDIALIHFPDQRTPLVETLGALASLMAEGKLVRYGVSNFTPEAMARLVEAADAIGMARPDVVQDELNLLRRDALDGVLPLARREGLAFLAFFPLASGLLTGRYSHEMGPQDDLRRKVVRQFDERFLTAENLRKVAALKQFSARADVAMVRLALHWLIAQSGVAGVIVGASRSRQLATNLAALATPTTTDMIAAADRITA